MGLVSGEPGLGTDANQKSDSGCREPGEQTRDLAVFPFAGSELSGGS